MWTGYLSSFKEFTKNSEALSKHTVLKQFRWFKQLCFKAVNVKCLSQLLLNASYVSLCGRENTLETLAMQGDGISHLILLNGCVPHFHTKDHGQYYSKSAHGQHVTIY